MKRDINAKERLENLHYFDNLIYRYAGYVHLIRPKVHRKGSTFMIFRIYVLMLKSTFHERYKTNFQTVSLWTLLKNTL